MSRRGRPRRSIEKVREFGKLVTGELEHGETLEQILLTLHRSDPRWGTRRTMMRLWAAYRAEQAREARLTGPVSLFSRWQTHQAFHEAFHGRVGECNETCE